MKNLTCFFVFIVFFNTHIALSWDGKLSTGQVLSNTPGEEGIHEFASPSEKEKLMEAYAKGGDQVGVFNKNLFIMMDDGIINVPMGEISGIPKEELNNVISEAFIEYEVKTVTKYVEMPPEEIAKLDGDKLAKVPPKAMAQMGEGQIRAINPEAMIKFKPEQMSALPPQVIQHFQPDQFAALPPDVFGEMKIDMLNAIDPKAFEKFNPEQIQKIVVPQFMPGTQPLPPLPDGNTFQMPELNENFAKILPPDSFHQVDAGVIIENSQMMAETLAFEMAKGMSKEMAEQMAGQMAFGMAMDLTHDIAKGMAGGMSLDMARGMAQDIANNMAMDQAGQMAKGVLRDLDGDGEFHNMMPPPNQMHQMMGVAHHHAIDMAGQVSFKAGQDMLLGFVKDGLIGADMLPEGMKLPEGFVPPHLPPGMPGMPMPGGEGMQPLADGTMPPIPNMPEGVAMPNIQNMASDVSGQQAQQMVGQMAVQQAGQMANDMAGQQAQQMAQQMAGQQAQHMAQHMAGQAAQHMAGHMAAHQAQHAAQGAAMDMAKDINEGKMPPPPEGMGPPPNGHGAPPPGGQPPPQ